MSDLVLKDINKIYPNGFHAVHNFNLEIKNGEFIVFVGPSGCGKSTTLRMIAGLEEISKGDFLINGVKANEKSPIQRGVAMVFQSYALYPHLSVYDNLAFGLTLRGVDADIIEQKVLKTADILGLTPYLDRKPRALSGGQRQRVAVGRAIIRQVDIFLMDEPLSNLDAKQRVTMRSEIIQIHKLSKATTIYVTHDQEEALTMSDTIVVMNDGEIQQIGKPKEIYDEPNNAFVADFIGESNIYTGTMAKDNKVRFLNKYWDADPADFGKFPINEKVDIVVRPEDIIIAKEGKGTVDGVISSKIFKGMHYEYIINVGKAEVVAQSTAELDEGLTVGLSVEPINIQIMKKPFVSNFYDGYITKDYKVEFANSVFDIDILGLFPGAKINEEETLVDENGQEINVTDMEVNVEVPFDAITISDDLNASDIQGNIISLIYIGDHYEIMVRTEDEEDFILNTPDLWNENDKVSVIIDQSKINISRKGAKK